MHLPVSDTEQLLQLTLTEGTLLGATRVRLRMRNAIKFGDNLREHMTEQLRYLIIPVVPRIAHVVTEQLDRTLVGAHSGVGQIAHCPGMREKIISVAQRPLPRVVPGEVNERQHERAAGADRGRGVSPSRAVASPSSSSTAVVNNSGSGVSRPNGANSTLSSSAMHASTRPSAPRRTRSLRVSHTDCE